MLSVLKVRVEVVVVGVDDLEPFSLLYREKLSDVQGRYMSDYRAFGKRVALKV